MRIYQRINVASLRNVLRPFANELALSSHALDASSFLLMVLPMRRGLVTCLSALLFLSTNVHAQELVSVRGSTVVARTLVSAQADLDKEHGIKLNFVPEVNGLELVEKLGRGIVQLGLFTRKLSASERSLFPEKRFVETLVGKQVVLVIVPEAVWKSGIRALTKEQLRMIYEREVSNWQKLGGEDRDIVYFNREAGRGIWDLFMIFLYGDVRRAPLSKAEVINNPTDVRTSVEFNSGSISLLEYGELKGTGVHALGIRQDDGSVVEPTAENIASGKYELSRPLFFVTAKQPTGKVRELLEFMTSRKGQECVLQAGHLPLEKLNSGD